MSMNLRSLASLLNVRSKGNDEYPISGIRDIEFLTENQWLEDNSIYFIENAAVLKRHPYATKRGAVLTTEVLAEQFPQALIAPEGETRPTFIKLLKAFDRTPRFDSGISEKSRIDPSARIAPTATILPGAVIMASAVVGERCIVYPNVVMEPYSEIGDDTVLFPGVVLGHHCTLARHCIVHGATVIGADGFGFYDDQSGRHKIPQIGNVAISEHVEIGAGCSIDRATIETTSIGAHTKIDNQVHIAHNCRVGRYVYIAGNTGLAGSVIVEDGVMISGMVSIKDHVRLAQGTIVMGMSGVAQDTDPKTAYFGTPARPARQMHKMNAALERLPDLISRVRRLEESTEPERSLKPTVR